jgi:hypothetical protein
MADSVSMDFSDLLKLSADLGTVPVEAVHRVRQATEISIRNVKDTWQKAAAVSNPEHAKRYPNSIDYDMELGTNGEISAVAGPNLAKSQGALGFLEDAPGGVSASPQHNDRLALALNIGDYERGLLIATEGLTS